MCATPRLVTTVLTDASGGAVRITDFAPRFEQFRPHVPSAAAHAHHRAGRRAAAHHDPLPPDLRPRPAPTCSARSAATTSATPAATDDPAHHRRAALLYRPRGAVRAVAAGAAGVRRRYAVRGRSRHHLPRVHATARATTGRNGSAGSRISYEWQDAVIRAAITLKLSSFEETGAIIAAHTTSIPEAPGSGRTWDYRFCWLRDAYFVVRALNRIGAIAHDGRLHLLHPHHRDRAHRRAAAGLQHRVDRSAGGAHRRRPEGLSRRRAGAHRQCGGGAEPARHLWQRDPRGDADVLRPAAAAHGRRESVPPARAARRNGARSSRFEPDAGIWEYRERKRIHTHSVAMCWAGCQRLEAIAAHLGLDDRAAYWGEHAAKIHAEMLEKALESEARRLHGGVRLGRSRRQRAAAARARRDRGRPIRVSSPPSTRSSGNSSATSTLCATAARTISACPRRRS